MQTRFIRMAQPAGHSMNVRKRSNIGLALAAALVGVLTGCVGYVEESHHVRGYAPAPAVYAQSGVVVQDDYVLLPRLRGLLQRQPLVERPGIPFQVASSRSLFEFRPW